MNAITTFLPSRYDRLDAVADAVEEILWRVGLPGQVRGGSVYPDALQMEIKWNCNPVQVDKCNRLNAAIKQTFGCYGGIDIQTLTLFLTAEKTEYTGIEVKR